MRGMNPSHAPAQAVTLSFAPQQVAPGTNNGPVRFSGVAYSGGVVPQYGWLGDVAIDLDSLQNPDGDNLPVLIDHDASIDSIAGRGQITRATTDAGLTELHISGELTTATEAGQRIARLMAEGYPLQMSVGMAANVREVSQAVPLNGRTLNVAAVFEQALVREVSFVAVGADPNTLAQQRLAATAQFSHSTPPASKDAPSMPRTPEDQALIDGLQQQLAALQAQTQAAAAQRRSADMAALFADLGRDVPTGDAAKPYQDMPEATFAVFAADLRAAHQSARKADSALFNAQGTQRAQQPAAQNTAERGAGLLAAVQNLSARSAATV